MTTHILLAACALAAGVGLAGERKYIASGWEFNSITPDDILQHIDQFEAAGIDGAVLYVNQKRADGSLMSSRGIMHDAKWTREDFAAVIPTYRKITSHRCFRASFLEAYRAPTKRIAWTDDAEWARVAHNLRVEAWLAKQGGFIGLDVDPEDYRRQDQYVRLADELPYPQLAALARRRGREVFSGIFAEFPDAKIMFAWLLTMGRQYWGGVNLQGAMADAEDLWPAFVDGIFDVLPPTATLIEGCENAYRFEADRYHFHKTASVIRTAFADLLSPENRDKYRKQVQVSFGLYFDSYVHPEGDNYYLGPVDGSRLKHLELNLAAATEATDEFVWFWSEKHGFVHWKEGVQRDKRLGPSPTWEDLMPGFTDVLQVTKDPLGGIGKWQKAFAAGEIKPVNANPSCSGTDEKTVLKDYSSWQEGAKYRRQGTFGWDASVGAGGALYAEGVDKGCFVIHVKDRKPGSRFGISVAAKGRSAAVTVAFLRNGAWDTTVPEVSLPIGADTGDWRKCAGSVRVPVGADGFGLKLNVHQAPGERTWFDDIAIYPIEYK